MKIIGKASDSVYLVEATDTELARAAGYRYFSDIPDYDVRHGYRIGTTIDVIAAFTYLQKLRENEKAVADSKAVLEALAKMLGMTLPTTFLPPDDAAETKESAS